MSTQQPDRAEQRAAELQRISGPALEASKAALQVPSRSAPDFALGNQGVVIRSLDDAWTFSNIVFNSGLAPKSLTSPAQVLIALQMGMEVGLPPMAAIQNTAVINGRPSLWGPIMLALCRTSGVFDEEAYEETWEYGPDGLATKAICTVRRLPNGKPIVREFTWAEAQAAKLDSKDTYKSYRKRMLQFRARGVALNDAFPDVLKGVISQEEASDLPPEKNVTPAQQAARPQSLSELAQQLAMPSSEPSEAPAETVAAASIEETGPAPETSPSEPPKTQVVNGAPPWRESPPPPVTPQQPLSLVTEAAKVEHMTLGQIKERLARAEFVADVRSLLLLLAGPKVQRDENEKTAIRNLGDARIEEIKRAGKAQKG